MSAPAKTNAVREHGEGANHSNISDRIIPHQDSACKPSAELSEFAKLRDQARTAFNSNDKHGSYTFDMFEHDVLCEMVVGIYEGFSIYDPDVIPDGNGRFVHKYLGVLESSMRYMGNAQENRRNGVKESPAVEEVSQLLSAILRKGAH